MDYRVYTDGSCVISTKNGGYGYVVTVEDKSIAEDHQSYKNTTNNRMELRALLAAMKYIDSIAMPGDSVIFYTDSAYIANCFKDKWYKKWLANGWRTANRVAVKNVDIWKLILHEYRFSKIEYRIEKVMGHTGDVWNEYADQLANSWRGEDEENFIIDQD